ncbi:MAG TPA: hypothetical protein VGD67_06720 [Pseudonocardiaceae bacterium]
MSEPNVDPVEETQDDPVGPVTLPGRVRAGARVLALSGMVLGINALGVATVVAPPFTTISVHGPVG